jgi:hypothetical protein
VNWVDGDIVDSPDICDRFTGFNLFAVTFEGVGSAEED